jgi:hypothetical protein
MAQVNFPFTDYYKTDFIDPLYYPYHSQGKFELNNFLNSSEVRINRGVYFKKKHSSYPCPAGYDTHDQDICYRNVEAGLFYQKLTNEDYTHREFFHNSTLNLHIF